MKIRADIFEFVGAAILMILLTSACGKTRFPANYILDFPKSTVKDTAPKQRSGAVLVREFRCPEYLCRGPIVYRTSPEKLNYYEYHRWAVNPRIPITTLMADTLQAQSLFEYVTPYEKGTKAAYILSGTLERLDEVDRGHNVTVECAITAEMIEVKTGSVIWSDRALKMFPVPKRDVNGVVEALTKASQAAVDELVKSMVKKLAPV